MFFRKSADKSRVLADKYAPAHLPRYGWQLEGFIPAGYSLNDPAFIQARYDETEGRLAHLLDTCDRYSSGADCDAQIDAQCRHLEALHRAEVVRNENQLTRIEAAWETRKATLGRKAAALQAEAAQLKAEIAPLEGVTPRFRFHIGPFSLGMIVTLAALIVDFFVNFNFLQGILLTNRYLLYIMDVLLCVMSDASMAALGTCLGEKKDAWPKPLRRASCIAFALMFLLSIVTTVMMRFGSMDVTFGAISASGEWVSRSYSMAEYGVTLASSFVTAATGILSFVFSYDPNAGLVRQRRSAERKLERCRSKLEPLFCEMETLENAPDLRREDAEKQKTAEAQIDALRQGLKLSVRKLLAEKIGDPTFTEKMADNLPAERESNCPGSVPVPLNHQKYLDKAS